MQKLLITLALLLNFGVLLMIPATVNAQAKAAVCEGIGLSSGSSDCAGTTTNLDGTKTSQLDNIIKTGLNIFSVIIGIVAVIMIMVGGLRYITSGGDSGKTASAKDTILYAIIGLVVVALAQIIVKFVIKKVG